MNFVFSSVCGITLLSSVHGHSWIACSDYDMSIDMDADDFDNVYYESSCSGYPRSRGVWSDVWAFNSGIDYELFEDGTDMCEHNIGSPDNEYSDTYDTQYPMATYTVGEMKRLIWPAKNHADYGCHTGGDQLDHKMQLWVNPQPNPTSDLGNDPETDGYTLVIDWHEASGQTFTLASCTDGDCSVQSYIGIDGVPFQNCPKFCDNQDEAVCYGDFQVPNIFPEDGYYTFVWYWAFKANEIYTHCFEVYIQGTESYTSDTIDSSDESNGNSTKRSNLNKKDEYEEDSVGAIIWSVVTFVILFSIIIITCLVLKKKEYIICTENSIIWNGSNGQSQAAGLVEASGGNTHAITTTSDGPRPSGTMATRPPPPPPVR